MQFSSTLRRALWIACMVAPRAPAIESVTLEPVADTTLFETEPLNNMGATPNFVSGSTAGTVRSRAVMRFDVAGRVPPGATIISAVLTLTVVKVPAVPPGSLPADSTFELHRLLEPWGEGNKDSNTGLIATTGEASWNARLFPVTLWTTPGGAAGTDFLTNVSSSAFVEDVGSYTFASTSNLTADVQSWLDAAASNFGWILITQDEATARTARRFASREAPTNAPALMIDYLSPPSIAEVTRQDSNMTCHFTVEAGYNYAVEYAEAIPPTNWFTLTNFGAKVAGFEATVTNSLEAAASRFFRLSRVPCNCR